MAVAERTVRTFDSKKVWKVIGTVSHWCRRKTRLFTTTQDVVHWPPHKRWIVTLSGQHGGPVVVLLGVEERSLPAKCLDPRLQHGPCCSVYGENAALVVDSSVQLHSPRMARQLASNYGADGRGRVMTIRAKQSKVRMCNGRRHVPLCPARANEK